MEVETQTVAEPAGRQRNRDNPAGSVVLGPKDTLVGKLHIEGDIRVQGSVEGELDATGDVNVDSGASVNAAIQGRSVNVRGQVAGSVSAQDRLLLSGSAVLTGDFNVGRLAIEDGATLNGHVSMQPAGERGHREARRQDQPDANGEAPAEGQG